MNKMKAWQGSYGVSAFDGIVSPAYYIFNFTKEIDPDFFHYAIRSSRYISYFGSASDGVRIGQWDLSRKRMKNIVFISPPLTTQTAIATYLDRKTTQIDAAIAAKERSIELLKERRAILVQRAVTRGLDETVEMKDSGVDWIGEVPKTWQVKKVRHLGSTQNGISAGAEYFGSGYPFVSYGDVYKNRQLPETVKGLAKSSKHDQEQYSILRGDILFTRTSETVEEIAIASTVFNDIQQSTFAGFLIRFRPNTKELIPEFSKFYFSNNSLRSFFVKEMNLVIRASLSQSLLKQLPVLLPSLSEQKLIASYCENLTRNTDNLIHHLHTQINHLREYRTVLIDAAVTGKVRVSGG